MRHDTTPKDVPHLIHPWLLSINKYSKVQLYYYNISSIQTALIYYIKIQLCHFIPFEKQQGVSKLIHPAFTSVHFSVTGQEYKSIVQTEKF